ncbi:MAG TPA: phosphoribosylaminoimidazolesuccinocarboxamide synthase [Actinocrinis sp.]|jgi:phosphoribosylaminoimidazole-succinocarboxamide synthase|uniref:phosphoribosylaminoimidazolesuccinocarboxamide synthase n=1 Tax=Actinocrinis sp. TaxID=1920516 RepID=UPI002DDCDB0A|nr:phosphoribosylaminoimidazolesuccinocarboxamide synthase [Actinocrinis sp.]HEV3173949.1 phosphoribosylaminoimidazolesuccinocarboxamide synthase [Actinocrinis sp.]
MAVTSFSGATHLGSGKIRELYGVRDTHGVERLLLVASDRISAYDHVLQTPIPDKGRVLTQLSLWWFERLADLVPNHVVTADPLQYPEALAPHADELRGRSMLCEKLDMIAVECVARGYLAGSGLAEYRVSGTVCGIPLPGGLLDGSGLPEPIFTPAAKAQVGEHDENIGFDEVVSRVGAERAAALRDLTLGVYRAARDIALERGIILADTKFEFGARPDGTLVLADEVLTPDSSRFWPVDGWEPGHAQPSFDKQFVRDWLTSPASGWDPKSDQPPPPLPDEIIERTRDRYIEVYERLTSRTFQ